MSFFIDMIKPVAKHVLLTWERMESGVNCDLTSSAFKQNPYPTYDRLRRIDPVHRMRIFDSWMLTKHEDIQAILSDHKRFSNDGRGFDYTPYISFLDKDQPDHTRLRSLVSKAFTPRTVANLAPRIQETVDELLDNVTSPGRFDLMKEIAIPLPVIVIAEMIGVPVSDRPKFRVWSDEIALTVEPILTRKQIERVQGSTEEILRYFDGIIEQRRQDPADDLLSALIAAEEQGDKLTHEELLVTLMLLLVAGNETTRNLIGNGMLALLKNPLQLERLRQDEGLLDSALDEFLRYDSPVQIDGRIAATDVTIGGKQIREGQLLLLMIGAANRDPSVFSDPDRLDIGREGKGHISFGRGIHYCLGAPLAILEARIAFASMLARFGSLRLVSEPEYTERIVLRGLGSLWVEADSGL